MVFYKLFVRFIGENPGIFTEGSCYLTWIAESYGLQLGRGYDTSCRAESGSKNITVNHECQARNGRKCIFDKNSPDINYNKCLLSAQDSFGVQLGYNCLTFPTSKEIDICCSIYPTSCEELKEVYADIVNNTNTEEPTTAAFKKVLSKCGENINAFSSTCANDCPGVDASDIVAGGAALLATTAVTAATSFVPPVLPGLVGVAGLGAIFMMSQRCMGPIFCTSSSGQCCRLVVANGGLTCPSRC